MARKLGEEERSNWLGKSALLEAIHFAITGKLNSDRHAGADGWISDGEKTGYVQLEFDTGVVIRRERKKSTQIYYFAGGKPGEPAKGDEAQTLIEQTIGLTPEDATRTFYFQQRKMAHLVLARPEERMSIISNWLRLEPLERGEEILREKLTDLATRRERLVQGIEGTRNVEAREFGDWKTIDDIDQAIEMAKALLQASDTQIGEWENKLASAGTLTSAKDTITNYDNLVAECLRLNDEVEKRDEKKIDTMFKDSHETYMVASASHRDAQNEASKKRKLVVHGFDGTCPVANIECPATQKINLQVDKNEESAKAAEHAAAAASVVLEKTKTYYQKRQAEQQEFTRLKERWTSIREQVGKLETSYEEAEETVNRFTVENLNDVREKLTNLRHEVSRLTTSVSTLEQARKMIYTVRTERTIFEEGLKRIENEIATHREALVIFGKQGAQRRVAESAITEIEDNANALLRECGINLSVEVRWSRESGNPAKTCDACGNPFPSSAKIKTCERCGTARGSHLINKMDILLSEQSGAAEDLVGAAIQLSASAWLRSNRESKWSTALIDEPFGQLDASNRRAFASHLASMLRGQYGFAQSFVIAHHSSILDALPGRIEIVNDGASSKLQVLA